MFLHTLLLLLGLASVALARPPLDLRDLSDDEDYGSSEAASRETGKVYGASYAPLGQFPFMAVIHRLVDPGKFFACSGSIISKRWVLTAGHCVHGQPRKFLLVLGVVDKSGLRYDRVTGGGVSMISPRVVVHPGFGQGVNDIGLVHAPRDIPFSDTIQPIRLAGKSYSSWTYEGMDASIFGWGQEGRDKTPARRLSYGIASIMSIAECLDYWRVNDDHICTEANEEQNVCQGDSGGPLVIRDNEDEPIQIGIDVSYGDAGCSSDRPAVYTRVSSYEAWIHEKTGIGFY